MDDIVVKFTVLEKGFVAISNTSPIPPSKQALYQAKQTDTGVSYNVMIDLQSDRIVAFDINDVVEQVVANSVSGKPPEIITIKPAKK